MLIELCGTPLSGKSSTVEVLQPTKNYSSFKKIAESFSRCPFDDSNFELGVLWTIFDTYAEANRIVYNNLVANNRLIVFDRGVFDRLAFSRLLSIEDIRYADLARNAEEWLKGNKLLSCLDRIFVFLTTYEKAKERKMKFRLRPDSKFRIINPITINRLNTIYIELYEELKDKLPIIVIDDINVDLSLEQKASIVASYTNGQG